MEEYGVLIGAKDQASHVYRKIKTEMQGLSAESVKAAAAMGKPEEATRRYARSLEGLNERLKNYKQQRSLVDTSDLRQLERYNQLIDGTKRRIRELTTLKRDEAAVSQAPGSSFGNMRGGLSQVISSLPIGGLPGRMAGMAAMGFNPLMIAGAGIAAGATFAVRQGLSFERAMSKVNATALLGPAERKKLSDQVIDIAQGQNFDATETANALEIIISQTNDLAKSMQLLVPTMKAARAGFVDVSTAAAAGAQILSATAGREKLTAQEIFDTLLKAKQEGAGDFTDFANNIPRLVSTGSMLGMNFKDVAGAYSAFTGLGYKGDMSSMLMENLMTFLQRSKASDFKSVGLRKFDKSGERVDLLTLIGSIRQRTMGMTDQQRENFYKGMGLNDAQARIAMSALVNGFEKLKSVMEQVNDSAGTTNETLLLTGDHLRNLEVLQSKIGNASIKVGNLLLEFLDETARDILVKYTGEYVSPQTREEMRRSMELVFIEDRILNAGVKRPQIVPRYLQQAVKTSDATSLVDKLRSTAGGAAQANQAVQDMGLKTQEAVDEIADGGRKVLSYVVNINRMVGVEHQHFDGAPDRRSAEQSARLILENVNRALEAGAPNLAAR